MIEIRKLSKLFNQGTVDERLALNDISININDGDFICLIGANGSGKSTLLNCLSGNLIPETGNIIMDGKDITLESEHGRAHAIGHLFQDPMAGTAPHMSVEENLALAAKSGSWLKKISSSDREWFRQQLQQLGMGLENKLSMEVGLLSGGMRQALTLIMATINTPKILLLDEHTAALDPQSADQVLSITRRMINDNGLTSIMITHNMKSALELGNRLWMMHEGKIILDLNEEEKKKLSIDDLRDLFRRNADAELDNERMLLL